jgi:hypothetical protein
MATVVAALIGGCYTAKVTESEILTPRPARPSTIYVANFQCSSASTNAFQKISDKQLAELQEALADSLVTDLNKQGYRSVRLSPHAPSPSDGWLVRGRFAKIDKGNPSARALFGFGAGKENVRVICSVDRLSKAQQEPLYELQTEAGTRNLPGSLLTPVPMLIAVRFAKEEDSLEKDVEKTASEIAAQIRQQLQRRPDEASEIKESMLSSGR